MKSASSLFTKILAWFFLNLIIVAVALAIFFAFQPLVNLHAIFGQEGTNRLWTASLLIAHDLSQLPQTQWPDVLDRHAAIHQVDFTVVFENGSHFSSTDGDLPESVLAKVRQILSHQPPRGPFPPPHDRDDPQGLPQNHAVKGSPNNPAIGKKPSMPPEMDEDKPHFMIKTQRPTMYWSGIRIPRPRGPLHRPVPAVLLAVSDSVTGNGFFFDPLPWMVVAAVVILISVLFWIPMVRNITRPLARMTRATEKIANGHFDAVVHEPRADEIGRLASTINHMAARLSVFVKGQKRFLGDVAHELGSPIARIQFGLGALEQRVEKENRQRVRDVLEDVDHLSNLVNELLAFSRAEIRSDTVKLERIDLLPVVQTAVNREGSPADRITVRIEPEIRVVASSELLTRALANLVRNAVKYAGGSGPIVISAKKRNGVVDVDVRDAGAGVADDLLDRLFEPFFRPEASRDRQSGGVGLGLAIVKTCVETCRGTVSAANLKPEGFAVTITLKAP